MKKYFCYFKWLYLILGILLLVFLTLSVGQWGIAKVVSHDRTNTQCMTTERVFDYADVLSDKEEEKLRKLIAKRERQTGCDIVLVTLNESLKDYAEEKEPWVYYDEFVRVYAEDFWETNNMGYDKPNGDGVILVDNWYREDDGKVYTWFCTTGKVKEAYSDEAVNHILDNIYRYVEKDPYKAYKTYVNDFYHDMLGINVFLSYVPGFFPWLMALIVTAVFIFLNWNSKEGEKTVTATTYVAGKQPHFQVREDRFIRKAVVSHRIQSSSSSGGGSSHSGGGGGGGSHGGGGHSR
jgi:uncharacterized membrane protein YgcG